MNFETLKDASKYTTLSRKVLSGIINLNKISKTGWCLYFKGVETIESVADYKKLVISE